MTSMLPYSHEGNTNYLNKIGKYLIMSFNEGATSISNRVKHANIRTYAAVRTLHKEATMLLLMLPTLKT